MFLGTKNHIAVKKLGFFFSFLKGNHVLLRQVGQKMKISHQSSRFCSGSIFLDLKHVQRSLEPPNVKKV